MTEASASISDVDVGASDVDVCSFAFPEQAAATINKTKPTAVIDFHTRTGHLLPVLPASAEHLKTT